MAALLDEGLHVVLGLAAVGLHAPALLMGHGQGMRRSLSGQHHGHPSNAHELECDLWRRHDRLQGATHML